MSHWNHRVVRSKFTGQPSESTEEYEYTIREVYYNDMGEIVGITENAMSPYGETPEDLKLQLERMLKACEKDILIEEEIKYGEWDNSGDAEE